MFNFLGHIYCRAICILQHYFFTLDQLVDSTRRPIIKDDYHVTTKMLIGQVPIPGSFRAVEKFH